MCGRPTTTSGHTPSLLCLHLATVLQLLHLVAGGYGGTSLSTVEVLDVHNKQWSTGPSTPAPWYSMMSIIIGDTWFLMGGWCGGKGTVDVYSASLDSLVSQLMPNNLSKNAVWNKISGHKH